MWGQMIADIFPPPTLAFGQPVDDLPADISCGLYAAGTGNAVTDLIFSIAKRDVTFFSGTALISFL